ncbi:sensor histidine kinase [Maribacter hydrothermalis]|uniref:histidine kinase n=1 Tax=Maribacter hydrothermalis TaxID=1836467 RepID=A0A1B7Z1V0_9FLAO|nr:HAMP domain-containing sensor histidine kinase [Maribacter hydrothermalis]APQ18361.1 histidine kinase [Maribacter hydrothermalis]OBR36707.1 histidine kinase [Maribacter hydrothermalis]
MHSLLKRQIRKYLSTELESKPEMVNFLEAIEKSYENYDDKFSMLHRSSKISSDELFEANKKLQQEALQQKGILISLENAIRSLTENLNEEEIFNQNIDNEINAENLAGYISNLAIKVSKMTVEKDKLLKSLEFQNQSLNDYAQMVSHDLKSPIRNINALMSWIVEDEKEKFSNTSKENCSLVHENLMKMDKLISGILNHATMGETKERSVEFNVGDVLKEIEKTIYVPGNITFEYAKEMPKIIFVRSRFEQLFMNLFTNAVNATEHKKNGHVKVGYETDEVYWKFSVSDNGKGIAAKHQESIFHMFKKLETTDNATGIGLAIVKKIVALYDGDVWLESQENKGTTFYITLKKKL